MMLSMEWLSEFIDVSETDIKSYCDRMTATGSKVEGWETLGEDITNVKLVKITKIEKHPDADRLLVCQVDTGSGRLQIVTAATNVFEGAYVPAAIAPCDLPGGVKIKPTKMRGVPSDGMFCSIEELNLTLHDQPGAAEDGILILTDEEIAGHVLGDDIRDVLAMRDSVVEFEITPNRPDCLSVIGLARETGASYEKVPLYHTPKVKGSGGDISDYLTVSIEAPDLCPRYTARVVRNVKIAPSPMWLRRRLRACGVRPINNIVDITNYVMLEYGQPMHAFDYTCLDGAGIVVRRASEGEKFISLDNKDHTLCSDMLVIADRTKPVALAGIMGGANSEILDSTSTVVFESANFNGASVRITSKALGMRTESSGRFEKGLDAECTLPAVERACELVEMLGAGEVVDGITDVYPGKREQTVLPLEPARYNAFLGVDISREFMVKTLVSLGFGVEGDTIYVPSWRADVACMNDIAEEIIRIYGYNEIQSTAFTAGVRPGSFTPAGQYKNRLAGLLTNRGFDETCTFSFISPRFYDRIGLPADSPLRSSIVIRNPLGEDTSVMRTIILPSVLEALERNNNYHSEPAVALFETANVYSSAADGSVDEHIETALAFYGCGDFYSLKGAFEAIFADAGIKCVCYTAVRDNPTYHPGRCAKATVNRKDGETLLAVFGELHPEIAAEYGFDDTRVYAGTLKTDMVLDLASFWRLYTPLPKYPAVTRDFAFVCDDTIESAAICEAITKAAGKLVENVSLFDVYKGAQIPEGKVSLAYKVTLRAADRTLTDEEAEKASAKITKALDALGAQLRA